MIDVKLSFKQYEQYASDVASIASVVLKRILPNLSGPQHIFRLLTDQMVNLILLYTDE